ncbi:MAG TPA: hypothetical protein VJ550_11600, partial [Geomonas sp.]|nr:hypothetical protein [Geomonas sp.]
VGGISYNYKLAAPLTFTFMPAPGYKITAINGIPADEGTLKVAKSIPAGVNQKATITLPAGYVITSNISMTAVGTLGANGFAPIAPITSIIGSAYPPKLVASTLLAVPTDAVYTWTFVSGPANTASYTGGQLTSTNGPSSFTPGPVPAGFNLVNGKYVMVGNNVAFPAPVAPSNGTNLGQYKFQVNVTSASDPTVNYSALAVANVVADQKNGAINQCQFCHTANKVGFTYANGTWTDQVYSNWSTSIHHDHGVICSRCHAGANSAGHPGVPTCQGCHTGSGAIFGVNSVGVENSCKTCHSSNSNTHAIQDGITDTKGCVDCHSVAAPQHNGGVNDNNNGVRAVVGEFSKWSHHVTGVTLNNAHCAACHLEGKTSNGAIVVDETYHMANNKIHLRDTTAGTDADFAWDPSAPSHSGMDQFCMSCHDSNGAVSPESANIQAYINTAGIAAPGATAGPLNPFGDTISNRYDKMFRPRVTDVSDQFNTSNNSHHAVKGPRYSGRTRAAGPRQIASAATFAQNSTALLQGVRSTIYDAGNFNALYVPLSDATGEAAPRTGSASLGDDSTLHCGDCHTVGQWKAGSATNADGSATPVAIGAHGSNNEYLLRNTLGTDQRHTQNAYVADATTNVVTQTNPNGAFLVCYNCHAYTKYGSTFIGTGADAGNAAGDEMGNIQPHAGEYAQAGRCNGAGNTISFAGYTTGTATDGTQFESRLDGLGAKLAGEQTPDFGNIYGIQCLNCHNSGYGNALGGIHGSANNTSWNNGTTVVAPNPAVTGGAYIDGAGNTNKVERFLPGLNNAMHVPGTLGGVNGGTTYSKGANAVSNDTNWEQKHWQQKAGMVINYKTGTTSGLLSASAGAGCYTLGETGSLATDVTVGLQGPSVTGPNGQGTEAAGTWGACDDHTAAQGAANHGFLKRIVRPVTY